MGYWAVAALAGVVVLLLWALGVVELRTRFLGRGAYRKAVAGKTVWITGASSGIGEALARLCHECGAHVILSARRRDVLERVAAACRHPQGGNVMVLPLDLSNHEQMPGKAAEAASWSPSGQIDVLVNNGGISTRGLARNTSLEIDKKLMDVNYFGSVSLTKAVLPHMLRLAPSSSTAGAVVVVSSVQGKFGMPLRAAYSASKHALHGFFDSLRLELQHHNVHVLMACPGYVRTNLSLNAVTSDGAKYGKMDERTAKGYSPAYVAERILSGLVRKQASVDIAPVNARVAMVLNRLCPALLAPLLRRRSRGDMENYERDGK